MEGKKFEVEELGMTIKPMVLHPITITNTKANLEKANMSWGGHPAKSNKPRELNYRVHFIHWRKNLYKTWIYHSLQSMLETSLYVKQGMEKSSFFQ